mmetsp:Transcript_21304/g.52093  ORF Transcript_21304/g.52093 Transcript_21304/m.52093 type:complete len:101 (-) Transcript_21304:77-379(-)
MLSNALSLLFVSLSAAVRRSTSPLVKYEATWPDAQQVQQSQIVNTQITTSGLQSEHRLRLLLLVLLLLVLQVVTAAAAAVILTDLCRRVTDQICFRLQAV